MSSPSKIMPDAPDLDALLRDAEQYARVTDQTPASFIPQLVAALRGAVETEDQILTEVCNLLPEGSPERDAAHSTRLSGSRVGVLHLVSEWVRGAVEERNRLLAALKADLDLDAPQGPVKNTDRELWREREGDYYAPSIFVTEGNGIGIDVGGQVIVLSVQDWHRRAEMVEHLVTRATRLEETNIEVTQRADLAGAALWAAGAAREAALHLAILSALNELGVPHPGYPAPISNAAAILRAAVTETAT